MEKLLAGKTAVVTGSGKRSGIGYAVAKAGVIMLTKVMAAELAGNGVRVNAI